MSMSFHFVTTLYLGFFFFIFFLVLKCSLMLSIQTEPTTNKIQTDALHCWHLWREIFATSNNFTYFMSNKRLATYIENAPAVCACMCVCVWTVEKLSKKTFIWMFLKFNIMVINEHEQQTKWSSCSNVRNVGERHSVECFTFTVQNYKRNATRERMIEKFSKQQNEFIG